MAKQKRKPNRPPAERKARPIEAELVEQQQPGTALQLRPQQTSIQERTTPTLAELTKRAEDTIKLYNAIVTLIAGNVRPSQMTVYGNIDDLSACQVHFSNDACKKILKWVGADFQLGDMEEKDYDCPSGPAREFVQHATVWDEHGRECSIVGNRSTYDEFFSRRRRKHCPKCDAVLDEGHCRGLDGKDPHGKIAYDDVVLRSYDLPMTEVDIPSVRQAAISNAWNKALAAVGYLPAIEDLKAANVDLSKLRAVSFDRGKEGGKMKEPDTVEQGAIRAEVSKLLEELTNKDRGKMEALLMEVTAFKDFKGHRSVSDVTIKQLPYALDKLKKMQKGDGKPETAAAGPERAEVGKGVVTKIEEKKTGGGAPYLEIKQGGNTIYCFKDTAVMDRSMKPTTYFVLLKAIALNADCVFDIEFSKRGDQSYNTLKLIKRIGPAEWEDGAPVIQRGTELFDRQPGE